jgi:predicted transcriptional regulator
VTARADKDGRELGRTRSEFVVDRWSLEALRAQPDSAAMAGLAQASGGRFGLARDVDAWVHGLQTSALVRARSSSTRLWESPWVFAAVVGLLSAEWAWRRRRGLP